jgi:hypothetical protein
MERKGILLSHFYIYKFIKNFLIKIFLYNIDLEKNIYSFFARGSNIFSDSFFYRFKKKKKRKGPFSFERYKPDLFFILFLYMSFFSKKKLNKSKFVIKKKSDKKLNMFLLKKREITSLHLLNEIKEGNLDNFIKLPKIDKDFLKIYSYENKIKMVNFKKLNIGFLDFLTYIFYKINV